MSQLSQTSAPPISAEKTKRQLTSDLGAKFRESGCFTVFLLTPVLFGTPGVAANSYTGHKAQSLCPSPSNKVCKNRATFPARAAKTDIIDRWDLLILRVAESREVAGESGLQPHPPLFFL